MSIALGLDYLAPRQLSALPVKVRVRVLNLMMRCERLLKHVMDARAIFIPKNPDAEDPVVFRLITISSTLSRVFHRELSKST